MADWLCTTPIAHRGLHDISRGIVENSRSAFEAAADARYGIELDVHLAADGEVMVFHDRTLERLTDESGKMADHSSTELTSIKLNGSADTIPTLREILKQIDGRVPMLIELKSFRRDVGQLEQGVANLLDDYNGTFAIQSFNPYSVGWFAKNAPRFPRGQVSQDFFRASGSRQALLGKLAMTQMLFNFVSRPQFCAYDYRHLPAFGPARMRALGKPVLAWTVKDPTDLPKVLRHADNIIFEGFRPEDHGIMGVSAA